MLQELVPHLVGVVPDANVDGDRVPVMVQLAIQSGLKLELTWERDYAGANSRKAIHLLCL
jgi:hypothetical protein